MNYYVLECYRGNKHAGITRFPSLEAPLDNWMRGERWDKKVPQPLIFEGDKGKLPPLFHSVFLVMHNDIIQGVRS